MARNAEENGQAHHKPAHRNAEATFSSIAVQSQFAIAAHHVRSELVVMLAVVASGQVVMAKVTEIRLFVRRRAEMSVWASRFRPATAKALVIAAVLSGWITVEDAGCWVDLQGWRTA